MYTTLPSPFRRHALAAALLGACLQVAAQTANFDIPPQPVADALQQFARQAGVQLVFAPDVGAGRTSRAVSGTHDARAALRQLLQGTGLEMRVDGATWTVARAAQGTATLGEVRVTAQAQPAATTEGTGSYTTASMSTATKLPLSIRETPQSVSVITQQRIEDQGLTSLSDVMQAAPGFTVTKWGGERHRFHSRGFQVNNLMVDGLPITYEEAALSTGAMSLYDRVEVLRGTSGLTEGSGTPGGSINLVRKRPTQTFQGTATLAAGSWSNASGSLDLSGPLNEAGTLRGRTVLSHQDKQSFIEDYRNRRTLLYGILEADIRPDTRVSLGASYSNEDNPGVDWNGIGTAPDGSFLPIARSTRMSPSWSFWNKRSTTVFADLEHRLNNGWKAKLAATAIDSKTGMLGTYLRSVTMDSGGQPLAVLGGGAYDYDRTQRSIDGMLTGTFDAWGRTHDVVVGASHRRSRVRDVGGAATVNGDFAIGSFNPLAWDPGSIARPTIGEFGAWQRNADTEQSSLYATTRLAVGYATRLILGGRLDWYEGNQVQYDGDWPYGETKDKATRKFTPYAGLVHELNDTYSLYASWTRIFNPQSYNTANGGALPPQTGTNLEAGIKGAYLDGRLNASAAVFQIDLDNLPDALPASACVSGISSCFQSAGKVRSRGVEFELGGELARGWQMAASYTYASAKRVAASSGYDPIGSYTVGDRYATNIPTHLFKLATSYRLPGELHRWKVGGTLHLQNNIYSPWNVQQGGYAIAGLQASYAASQNWDLSLNVNNLFDRHYYSGIADPTGSNFIGDPRNVLLTARYRF